MRHASSISSRAIRAEYPRRDARFCDSTNLSPDLLIPPLELIYRFSVSIGKFFSRRNSLPLHDRSPPFCTLISPVSPACKEITSFLVFARLHLRDIFPCDLHFTQFPILRCISRKYVFPYSLVSQRRHGFANIRASTSSFVDVRYFVRKLYVQFARILQDS